MYHDDEQQDLIRAFSAPRFERYLRACGGDWAKALDLYLANIRLSARLFAVISFFEVVLRNAIDAHYGSAGRFGREWLFHQSGPYGFLAARHCEKSRDSVLEALKKQGQEYTHDKVVAALGFTFWRCLFASKEFAAAGSTLLQIFPKKPHGAQYNHTFVYKRLHLVNDLRNRIAHQDPICFSVENTVSAYQPEVAHQTVLEFLEWLNFEPSAALRRLDGVDTEIQYIEALSR